MPKSRRAFRSCIVPTTPHDPDLQTVVIIGGGFAGTLTAIHLIRSGAGARRIRVVLINRDPLVGPGVAYAAPSSSLLLNVPAARMSALPDEPNHFLDWARVQLGASVDGNAFLPRALYGTYLSQLFEETRAGVGHGLLDVVRATATDVEARRLPVVTLDNGERLTADRVVIARGHSLPRNPPVAEGAEFYSSARYARSPWSSPGLEAVPADGDVLLIGTGLTMCDAAILLRERGHRGILHVMSRRGLMPRAHAPRPLAVSGGPEPQSWLRCQPTARDVLAAIRRTIAANGESDDWRAVIDSLRPVTAELWQRLSARERGRFVQRLRPYWEVHRHRAPLDIHRFIDDLVAAGRLRLRSGHIRAWREDESGVTVDLGATSLRVAHVINCTGPDGDVHRSDDPLVRSLLARGLIVRDAMGLGVETAADGSVIDASGRPSSWLYTVGTWRKPALWESIAVPELRVQARDLARQVLVDLPQPMVLSSEAPLVAALTGPSQSLAGI